VCKVTVGQGVVVGLGGRVVTPVLMVHRVVLVDVDVDDVDDVEVVVGVGVRVLEVQSASVHPGNQTAYYLRASPSCRRRSGRWARVLGGAEHDVTSVIRAICVAGREQRCRRYRSWAVAWVVDGRDESAVSCVANFVAYRVDELLGDCRAGRGLEAVGDSKAHKHGRDGEELHLGLRTQ
jgi:hypothetical protein